MKKSQLIEMVRAIIIEELEVLIPEVLSEMYMQKIVAESVSRMMPRQQQQKRAPAYGRDRGSIGLAEALGEEDEDYNNPYDEHVPGPMRNSDQGVYQQGPVGRKNEVAMRMARSSNAPEDYAMLYDNVKSVGEYSTPTEATAAGGAWSPGVPQTDIPLEALGIRDFRDDMRMLNEVTSQRGPIQQTNSAVERELEMKRKKLDSIIVGEPKQAAPRNGRRPVFED